MHSNNDAKTALQSDNANIAVRRHALFIGFGMVEVVGQGMYHVGVMTPLPVYLVAAGALRKDIKMLEGIKRYSMLHHFLVDPCEWMVAFKTSRKGLKILLEVVSTYYLSELPDGIGSLYEQYTFLFSQTGIFRQDDTVLEPRRDDDLHAFIRVRSIDPAHAHELTQLTEHAVADECLIH
jgi:hypothetical protein